MTPNKLYKKSNKDTLSGFLVNSVVLLVILQIFFPAPFHIAGFQFEWAFFSSFLIIIDIVFYSRKLKIDKLFQSLVLFLFYTLMLSFFSFLRFQFNMVFIGFVHLIRSILLFIPYIWIISVISENEKVMLVRSLRNAIYLTILILITIVIKDGYLFNDFRLETVGLGKNSLGYTLICFSLFLLKYENVYYIKRPLPILLFLSLITVPIVATKSGTSIIFLLLLFIYTIIFSNNIKIIAKIIGSLLLLLLFFSIMFNVDAVIELLGDLRLYKIKDFLESIIKYEDKNLDTSNQLRLDVQQEILLEFDLNMALGRYYYYYFASHGYTAHQQYLQMLYDTGIIGLGLFLNFIRHSIKRAKFKFPVILIFLYSFLENFLIQFIGLIILALLIIDIPERKNEIK